MYFMLFTSSIPIYFAVNEHVCALYTHIILHTYCRPYKTAIYINVYMIMFNVYIMALVCFDRYAKAATLITDSLRINYEELLL